jgi:hypothetical protein
MHEGETADHVIVILDGYAEIWIEDDGREDLIARRGPGQLIGERAALQVSVRSATVVASGPVHALSMSTEDFARYVSEHKAVLDTVERQIYGRLTENPARHGASRPGETNANWDEPVVHGSTEASSPDGRYSLIVYTDVVGFGALTRSEAQRLVVVREMREVTAKALTAIWAQCSCEGRGDGLLIAVPPIVPSEQVLEYLLIALPIGLKRHNALYSAGAQMRLRVALDVGPVTTGPAGISGRVIIDAARLLEADAFKDAVRDGDADLGLIASDFVYQTTIRPAGHLTDPAAYAKVQVDVKETSAPAWMTLVRPPVQIRPQQGLIDSGAPG